MPLRSVLGVWLLLAFLMSLNGVFREKALAPRLGRRAADAVSAGLGITIILAVSGHFLTRVPDKGAVSPGKVAATWLGLTLAFEFLFGHFVDKKSWSELVSNYAIWRGRLWPVVLASVAAAPFLWLRLHLSPRV